jgi:hypothetical protein
MTNIGPSCFKLEYQPNVAGLAFCSLFAVFTKGHNRLTLDKYKTMPGSFNALWKACMSSAAALYDQFF